MRAKMQEIIVGITFHKAFRILDDVGFIFDELLNNNECFSPEYFPQAEYGGFQKILKNNETGNYLSLSVDSVIYCHHVESNDRDKEIANMIAKISKAVVPRIVEKYRLAITRIGMVFSFDVEKASVDKFKSKYFKDGVDVKAFRFSVSDGTVPAAVAKGINDFTNMIFTISKEQEQYKIAFDFQEYFSPAKPSWDDCHPSNFYLRAQKALQEKLLKEVENE